MDHDWQRLQDSDSLAEVELLMAIEEVLGREVHLDPSLSAAERTRVIRELAASLDDRDDEDGLSGLPVRPRNSPSGSGPASGHAS